MTIAEHATRISPGLNTPHVSAWLCGSIDSIYTHPSFVFSARSKPKGVSSVSVIIQSSSSSSSPAVDDDGGATSCPPVLAGISIETLLLL